MVEKEEIINKLLMVNLNYTKLTNSPRTPGKLLI